LDAVRGGSGRRFAHAHPERVALQDGRKA